MEEKKEFQHRSNGVFCVKVTDPEKKIPTISLEYAKECQRMAEEYLKR